MKKEKIEYVEPADYFPESVRKKHGLGEYADRKSPETIALETYKQLVRECLVTAQNCSEEYADKLMAMYDDDFQEAINDFSWPPMTMAGAMIMGY